jgi:hypothetical protein
LISSYKLARAILPLSPAQTQPIDFPKFHVRPVRASVTHRHGSGNRGRCSVSYRRSDIVMLVLREVVVAVMYARSRIPCRATSRLRSVITCFN